MTALARPEYGRIGRIGIGTPQANPTVEAEFAILLPRACTLHVTRLTSPAASPGQRLLDYLNGLDSYLAAYDTLRPDAFGFACTASSYLLGAEREARIIAAAADRRGYPVETAARAIVWGLERLRAKRIGLIVPYPKDVVDAACRYWSAAGIEVSQVVQVATRGADTRGIYELGSDRVLGALAELARASVDAVLVSGTGMPSLAALREPAAGTPVVSSNSCLAARLLDLVGRQEWLEPGAPAIRGWRQRFDESRLLNPPSAPGPRP
jgi:maleate isomerase